MVPGALLYLSRGNISFANLLNMKYREFRSHTITVAYEDLEDAQLTLSIALTLVSKFKGSRTLDIFVHKTLK